MSRTAYKLQKIYVCRHTMSGGLIMTLFLKLLQFLQLSLTSLLFLRKWQIIELEYMWCITSKEYDQKPKTHGTWQFLITALLGWMPAKPELTGCITFASDSPVKRMQKVIIIKMIISCVTYNIWIKNKVRTDVVFITATSKADNCTSNRHNLHSITHQKNRSDDYLAQTDRYESCARQKCLFGNSIISG